MALNTLALLVLVFVSTPASVISMLDESKYKQLFDISTPVGGFVSQ